MTMGDTPGTFSKCNYTGLEILTMTGKYYAIWLPNSRTYATKYGKLIIHDNRKEMEFIFPNNDIKEVRVNPDPEETIALRFVPGMEAYEFPLRREDFR